MCCCTETSFYKEGTLDWSWPRGRWGPGRLERKWMGTSQGWGGGVLRAGPEGSLDGLPKILESGRGKVRCAFKNTYL